MMKNKKYIPYILGALMIGVFGAGLWSMKSGKPAQQMEAGITPTVAIKRHLQSGSVRIAQANPGETARVGRPLKLIVSADTRNAQITDFDVILSYNSLAFDVDTVSSLVSDFTVAPFDNDSVLSITGFKTIGSDQPGIFSNTQIVEITVTPRSAGTNTFQILQKSALSTTKFIDSNAEVHLPEAGSVTVNVVK